MNGERVDLKTSDGVMDVYVFGPGGGLDQWPAVVLYMDAFGIRSELAGMAARLASNGYVVAVPNLYYRTPFAPFAPNVVVTEGPERDRFKSMIASIDHGTVMRDTAILLEWLARQPSVRPGGMAAVGYCMGGGYAISAAGTFPDRFAVAASIHGGSLATDRPDSPHRLADRIRAYVYVGAAETDASFPPEQRTRLEQALAEAGVRHMIETFRNTKHGFAVTGHVVYDREASELHWQRLQQVLKETVGV